MCQVGTPELRRMCTRMVVPAVLVCISTLPQT
jgi:hypothetical protein